MNNYRILTDDNGSFYIQERVLFFFWRFKYSDTARYCKSSYDTYRQAKVYIDTLRKRKKAKYRVVTNGD